VPTGATALDGTLLYGQGWTGAWRRISQWTKTGLAAESLKPRARFWAGAAIALMPWYFRGAPPTMPSPCCPGWGLLDYLVVTGGQVDGGDNSDIFQDGVLPADQTWLLVMAEPPAVPAPSVMPSSTLPGSSWLPAGATASQIIAGLSFFAIPPRNGTWVRLRFEAGTESASGGLLNRWGSQLLLTGGDTLVWMGGASFIDPTTSEGSSMSTVSSVPWMINSYDVNAQAEALLVPSSGGGSGLFYTSWRAGVARGGATVPRYGAATAIINVTSAPFITVSGTSVSSSVIVMWGGWLADGASSTPTDEVWALDVLAMDVGDVSRRDLARTLGHPPGLLGSAKVAITIAFTTLSVILMSCAVQERIMVRCRMRLMRSRWLDPVAAAVVRAAAAVGVRVGPDPRFAGVTDAEAARVRAEEAEEARQGISTYDLKALPLFRFSAATDADAKAPAAASTAAGFLLRASRLVAGAPVGPELAGPACPICLMPYEEGAILRRLPCGHFFHAKGKGEEHAPCVDTWLKRSQLCPLCKHSVLFAKRAPPQGRPPAAPPGVAAPAPQGFGASLAAARLMSSLRQQGRGATPADARALGEAGRPASAVFARPTTGTQAATDLRRALQRSADLRAGVAT
jgi:hypothetical protein